MKVLSFINDYLCKINLRHFKSIFLKLIFFLLPYFPCRTYAQNSLSKEQISRIGTSAVFSKEIIESLQNLTDQKKTITERQKEGVQFIKSYVEGPSGKTPSVSNALVSPSQNITVEKELNFSEFIESIISKNLKIKHLVSNNSYYLTGELPNNKQFINVYKNLQIATNSINEENVLVVFRLLFSSGADNPRLESIHKIKSLPAQIISLSDMEISKLLLTQPLVKSSESSLKIEIRTDKGKGNITYKEGEKMQLFVKVSHPCYLRLVYVLEDKSKILLLDNYLIGQADVGRDISVQGDFTCVAPFGNEYLLGYASEIKFCDLQTSNEQGFHIIKSDLLDVQKGCRGPRIQRLFGEDKLMLRTTAK